MIREGYHIALMESDPRPTVGSPLIQFYLGEASDSEGRYLRDIRAWNHARLEGVHDYIQWLFPTRQRSQFNANAPTLGPEEIRAFQADERLSAEVVTSLKQMLAFYGFGYREEAGEPVIEPADDWPDRQEEWFHPSDHNLLRITRILDCLSTLGLSGHAQALLEALETVCAETPGVVGRRTLEFWRDAVHGG